jgi:hypothetical protein
MVEHFEDLKLCWYKVNRVTVARKARIRSKRPPAFLSVWPRASLCVVSVADCVGTNCSLHWLQKRVIQKTLG